MHVALLVLLVIAALGPFAVLRFVAGVGCFALILAGLFVCLYFWLNSLPGVQESNPRPVATQRDYDIASDGVWIKLPDGEILQKGK